MSLRDAATAVVRELTGDRQTDQIQTNLARVAMSTQRPPFMQGAAIDGEADSTKPGGITDGVTFAPGQAKELYHGLGREALHFIVTDIQDDPIHIERDAAGLTPALKNSHIRLYNDASAGTARVKFWVY